MCLAFFMAIYWTDIAIYSKEEKKTFRTKQEKNEKEREPNFVGLSKSYYTQFKNSILSGRSHVGNDFAHVQLSFLVFFPP